MMTRANQSYFDRETVMLGLKSRGFKVSIHRNDKTLLKLEKHYSGVSDKIDCFNNRFIKDLDVVNVPLFSALTVDRIMYNYCFTELKTNEKICVIGIQVKINFASFHSFQLSIQ